MERENFSHPGRNERTRKSQETMKDGTEIFEIDILLRIRSVSSG